MEGRTIVRPGLFGEPGDLAAQPLLQWRAGQLSGQAGGDGWDEALAEAASMEGRTIVRPGFR